MTDHILHRPAHTVHDNVCEGREGTTGREKEREKEMCVGLVRYLKMFDLRFISRLLVWELDSDLFPYEARERKKDADVTSFLH